MSDKTLPLRVQAHLALAAKCGMTAHQHREAWARVELTIREKATARDKVFEVHHRIEAARERYFRVLVAGDDVARCEAVALGEVRP